MIEVMTHLIKPGSDWSVVHPDRSMCYIGFAVSQDRIKVLWLVLVIIGFTRGWLRPTQEYIQQKGERQEESENSQILLILKIRILE